MSRLALRYVATFVPAQSLAALAPAMLLLSPVSPAAAQHAPRLGAGTVVRVHSPRIVPAQPLVARLDSLTPDSLVFRYESGGMLQPSRALPVHAVSRLEVAVREPVRHGGTKGLLIGAAAGGLLGWWVGRSATSTSCSGGFSLDGPGNNSCTAGPDPMARGLTPVLGAAAGGLVGWWVGRHWKARRWHEVPLQ